MPPPPPPPQLPELPDDPLGEVFLHLPLDDPACLLRASLVCKSWRRILADPVFRRRHRELHRTPSVVGFVCTVGGGAPYASRFVSTNPANGSPAARDLPGWLVLDCRHGRALFLAQSPNIGTELNYDLVVWNPLTNEQHCLPRPSPPLTDVTGRHFSAAVLCSAAVEGCDHSQCHGGPFRVAFVWSLRTSLPDIIMSARVYSSETGNWSEPISVQHPRLYIIMMPHPSTLVGDMLYFCFGAKYALEYQLGAQHLSIIEGPRQLVPQIEPNFFMPIGDGGLGCMDVVNNQSSLHLRLWSREAASRSDGDARWSLDRVIKLEKLLPDDAKLLSSAPGRLFVKLLGFAEGTDVIFVGTSVRSQLGAMYMIQLNSGRARKLLDKSRLSFPYTSFCIPVTDTSSTTGQPGDGMMLHVHDNLKLVHGFLNRPGSVS